MARKPSQANETSLSRTHQSITADIAEFRKRGGRIQILGNTPLRSLAPAAFRSNPANKRKPAAQAAAAEPPKKQVASR